ncbi:YveK family protein [Priestia megaterium]|uniref:YveK family protein n=1 Tax=Priestia megaterium TaxID=1404 RepID=UPI00203A7928|nr:Wzz/FepE/Etk N-terminal domain-containing protein [Priestia megaterium]MCM3546836.1 Wzz/FepE/Etk N-terminal domain-containing protein [Priestia megaterium]
MQDKLQLKDLFYILKKRWLTILATLLLASTSIAVVSFYVLKPTYQASAQVLVNQATSKNVDEIANITQLNTQLISSYIDFIKNPIVLKGVKDELSLKDSIKDLSDEITIQHNENSQFINITVRNHDSKQVSEIANRVAFLSKNHAEKLMKGSNIQVLTDPSDSEQIFPKPLPVAAIAIVVSFMLGVGIAVLREYVDGSFQNEDEIEELIGLPVIGHIDLEPRKMKRNQKQHTNEAKTRRENLEF